MLINTVLKRVTISRMTMEQLEEKCYESIFNGVPAWRDVERLTIR